MLPTLKKSSKKALVEMFDVNQKRICSSLDMIIRMFKTKKSFTNEDMAKEDGEVIGAQNSKAERFRLDY